MGGIPSVKVVVLGGLYSCGKQLLGRLGDVTITDLTQHLTLCYTSAQEINRESATASGLANRAENALCAMLCICGSMVHDAARPCQVGPHPHILHRERPHGGHHGCLCGRFALGNILMHFKRFNWPNQMGNFYIQLPSPQYPYFDQLLAEAQEDGFDLANSLVLGVTTVARRKNGPLVNVVVIGQEFLIGERVVAPTLVLRHPDDGSALLSIISWHTVMMIPGNPLEFHSKWSPTTGEERAILNVRTITKHRELDAIPEFLNALKALKKGGGRPKESTAYPREEAIERIKETERLFATGRYSRERAAAIAFEMSNEKSAYAMYNRYRKKFLKK
jgi:hypothetical protein